MVPGRPSPQLDEAGPRPTLAGPLVPGSAGRRGWGGADARGRVSGAAAALLVLDERQNVGQWEGLAALATGEEVTTFVGGVHLQGGVTC